MKPMLNGFKGSNSSSLFGSGRRYRLSLNSIKRLARATCGCGAGQGLGCIAAEGLEAYRSQQACSGGFYDEHHG